MTRSAAIAATLLAATALTVGCMPLPPAAEAPPAPDPTQTPVTQQPVPPEPTVDPTPSDPTDTDPDAPLGELPATLPLDAHLPAGYDPVWGTSLYGDPRYEELPDNDFPVGQTMLLSDTETGCQIYANTVGGVVSDDDESSSISALASIVGVDGDEVDGTTLDFDPGMLATTVVTAVTGVAPDGNGTFAVRNHGVVGVTQVAGVDCDDESDELPYLEELATEVLFPSFVPAA